MTASSSNHITDHLVVTRKTMEITGAVSGGATVRADNHLIVTGAFAGDLVIEPEAIVNVIGSFTGTVKVNSGSLLVTGQSNLYGGARDRAGRYALAIGSVTTGVGAPLMLQPDGSQVIAQAGPNGKIEVAPAGSKFCVWDVDQQAFVPVNPS